jgi:hypothetical protein
MSVFMTAILVRSCEKGAQSIRTAFRPEDPRTGAEEAI